MRYRDRRWPEDYIFVIMDAEFPQPATADVFEVIEPGGPRLPMVLASPHSGRDYPAGFLAASRLRGAALRRSEDSFVDEIFAPAVGQGATLIRALFPRAFVDPNREAYELDPEMFEDPLPSYVNTRSPRVAAGLGTIARVVADGEEIYRGKLRFAEAERRVGGFYRPYHEALAGLIAATKERAGHCILVDCHSMPSGRRGRPVAERSRERRRTDIVLGDGFGTACARPLIDLAERLLVEHGYVVARNVPFAGGFTTRHYGRPREGVHALQIEINRALYMDERRFERLPFLPVLARHMAALVLGLGSLPADALV